MATWRERLARWIVGAPVTTDASSVPVLPDPAAPVATAGQDEIDALRDRQDAVARTLAIIEAEARIVRAAQTRTGGRP